MLSPGVDTSLLDSAGVRGRLNSWSCAASQRDSSLHCQVLKISGSSLSSSLQIVYTWQTHSDRLQQAFGQGTWCRWRSNRHIGRKRCPRLGNDPEPQGISRWKPMTDHDKLGFSVTKLKEIHKVTDQKYIVKSRSNRTVLHTIYNVIYPRPRVRPPHWQRMLPRGFRLKIIVGEDIAREKDGRRTTCGKYQNSKFSLSEVDTLF